MVDIDRQYAQSALNDYITYLEKLNMPYKNIFLTFLQNEYNILIEDNSNT